MKLIISILDTPLQLYTTRTLANLYHRYSKYNNIDEVNKHSSYQEPHKNVC